MRSGKRILLCSLLLLISLMTGCFVKLPKETISTIDGDIQCEFRVGQNARFIGPAVETDAVFDKEQFIKLFNEDGQYDPLYLKYHLDECDLKINADEQPEEWDKIFNSEINIKAIFGEDSRSVSVHWYDTKLYFFVLCMGSKSKPEEIGYYYIELSQEMDEYWRPIIERVVKEAEDASSTPLTLDDFKELSEKGDELLWSDFKQYRFKDYGNGLYIKRYDIDETFELTIGGDSDIGKPKYIRLSCKTDGEFIDIRTHDVESFISAHI